MMQRGRKSAAGLSVVTSIPGQRPKPPGELTEDEAAIWRVTVATKPANWFTPDSWPILAAYCSHAGMSRRLGWDISRLSDSRDISALDKLLAMRERETRAMSALARAMRLTQQSRLKTEVADTAHRRTHGTTTRKPWETD